MHTAPHFILFEIVSVDGFIMLIVSGWPYWEMCLAHLLWTGPLSCCFVRKILQYSEAPWIFSPTNVSKASESLIKFALDAANPPAFSPTFMKNIFHLISAAGAAEKSAEGSLCPSPNSRPSSIDVLKKRRFYFRRFWRRSGHGPQKSTIFLFFVDFWIYGIPLLSLGG